MNNPKVSKREIDEKVREALLRSEALPPGEMTWATVAGDVGVWTGYYVEGTVHTLVFAGYN